MGLISRVSSRTYRLYFHFKKLQLTHYSKWLTENPEPSFAETFHETLLKICSSPFHNSGMLLTSKSHPTEKPADHEDSASSNSTPPKNANKLCKQLKASKLMDEKLFSPKVNHEKPKAVAEAATADEVADEAEVVTKEETAVSKLFELIFSVLNFDIFGSIKFNVNISMQNQMTDH